MSHPELNPHRVAATGTRPAPRTATAWPGDLEKVVEAAWWSSLRMARVDGGGGGRGARVRKGETKRYLREGHWQEMAGWVAPGEDLYVGSRG